MGYRYYYSTLPKDQRQVYEDLRRGLTDMAPSIRTMRLDTRTLSDILFCLRLDDPCLAFVKNTSFRAVRGADHVEVIPQYAFDPPKMRTFVQSIGVRVKKIAAPAQGKTEEEKLRCVHDWIIENVHYDKLYKNYAHEVLGPLFHGIGVCEGIAKTVKLLLDELQVECLIVIGEENAEKHGMEGMRHAWNIVRVDGKTYHVDATFDLSLRNGYSGGIKRYDYYKLSDAQIFLDHRAPVWRVPECAHSDGYYVNQRLTADSPEALKKLLARLGKKRGSVFVFQWTADGTLPMEEIFRVCGDFAASKGMDPVLHSSSAQRIMALELTNLRETS